MCDYILKLIIVGNSSVGKSSLLLQYTDKRFTDLHTTTIGVEFGTRIINIKNRLVKLQIWDTAGQESYRSITRSYYRGAIAAVLVYDVANKDSFNAIISWLKDIEMAVDCPYLILVGNKSDFDYKRQITTEEGKRFADEHNIMFIETSAKTNSNVENLFNCLTERILTDVDKGLIDPTDHSRGIKLGNRKQIGSIGTMGITEHKKDGCC